MSKKVCLLIGATFKPYPLCVSGQQRLDHEKGVKAAEKTIVSTKGFVKLVSTKKDNFDLDNHRGAKSSPSVHHPSDCIW